MKPPDLAKHIFATYFTLRHGIAILGIALPVVLWLGGVTFAGLSLQGSMSAYYHAGDGAMRDVFVGVLFGVGAFLYLYKGYTRQENIALNLAGVFVVGVALFPMQWACGDACGSFSPHGTFAVLFFLCIAYVCIFRASDTLKLVPDQNMAERYGRWYKLIGAAMVLSPAIAFALSVMLRSQDGDNPLIFFVEAVGVVVFGVYWILKSREIKFSNAERDAIAGRLSAPPSVPVKAFSATEIGPAVQQSPDR